jgi:uncharacterized membrane protein (DUF4010 family)
MMTEIDATIRLAIGALVGLGVGVEREWSGQVAGRPRFAGLRTFFMFGLVGSVSGVLVSAGHLAAGTVLVAGAIALAVTAYVVEARVGGEAAADATTEVAAIVVLTLGFLAGIDMLVLAAGAGAVVVLALYEKQRLHHAVSHLREAELQGALRFAVLALVVLPLLPEGPLLGAIQLRPRALWIVVLLFSALNFAAFIARRFAGERHGYGLVGMLGGLISSTAVTLDFSRRSRSDPSLSASLASGAIGACTVLIPRVLVVSAVLNADVAVALLPLLLPAALIGAAAVLRDWRQADAGTANPSPAANPLRLGMAIRMAVLFQVAMTAIDFVRSRWQLPGLYATAAALGLTDVDALTVAMSRTSLEIPADLAARAIAVGILANTMFKIALSLGIGTRPFRLRAAGGLGGIALAIGASLALA